MTALTNIDFYKADHKTQYPENTQLVYSNFTPRSSRLFNAPEGFDDKIVFFGLQYFIKDFLIDEFNREFFNQPKGIVLARYKRRLDNALGQGAVSVDHISALYDLGYLPLEIKALEEGSRVPMKVPVLTVKNTLPQFFWLTNYIETVMSAELWKPCTTATIAYEYHRILKEYQQKTGAPAESLLFQGHDFSFRGMSGRKDAKVSGMGHLLSFAGTDTVPAIDGVEEWYNADTSKELVACSVPATEHSVMCMGTKEAEIDTFRRLITELYPTGIVSIVSDTWDFFKVITEYTETLKEDILNRQPNEMGLAKTVFRPDSGDPVEILCGVEIDEVGDWSESETFEEWKKDVACELDEYLTEITPHGEYGGSTERLYRYKDKVYSVTYDPEWNRFDKQYYFIDNCGSDVSYCTFKEVQLTPQQKGAVECLWDIFGGTVTDKGYKVLHERVGLIYGDSITLSRCKEIMERLEKKGFASCNTVFGIGSYTYQYLTRDTFGFAMKATAGKVNGELREIFKDPATDSGTKKSAKGLLRVEKENNEFVLYDQQTEQQEQQGALKTVFRDGKLTSEVSLAQLRSNLGTIG